MKIAGGFLLRRIVDEWIVMSLGAGAEKAGEMFSLSESAALLWEALEHGEDEDGLAALLCETYETDGETARADVSKFLRRLEQAGILNKD